MNEKMSFNKSAESVDVDAGIEDAIKRLNANANGDAEQYDTDVSTNGAAENLWQKMASDVEASRNKINIREKLRVIGDKVLSVFAKMKGEKVASQNYLLSEHMNIEGRNRALKEIYDDWDDCGIDMPRELGEYMEKYVNDPKWWFGVHRSDSIDGAKFENDAILQSIMRDGLRNNGDLSSGVYRENPDVGKTVSHCDNMLHAVMNVKGQYKNSTGAVLVAIPSEYLVDGEGEIKKGAENVVYNYDKAGIPSIKPEYILGFVQNLGEGSMLKFKTREEILQHEDETNE